MRTFKKTKPRPKNFNKLDISFQWTVKKIQLNSYLEFIWGYWSYSKTNRFLTDKEIKSINKKRWKITTFSKFKIKRHKNNFKFKPIIFKNKKYIELSILNFTFSYSKVGIVSKGKRARGSKNKIHLLNHIGHICVYCNEVKTPEKLTVDHIIPLSKGGTNAFNNLTLACGPCNGKKGSSILAS